MIPTYMDVRQKRCGQCGGLYLPPGGGNGMCSDGCWVASRGRQRSQGELLSRSWQALQDRHERHVVGRVRVNAMLSTASAENDLKRYRQERRETLGLIERMQGRSRGGSVLSRSAADAECSGPACPVCAAGRRMDAARSRGTGNAEISR